jgi:hypothetical protein
VNRLVCWLGLVLAPLGAFAQVFGTVDAINGPVAIVSADGTIATPAQGQKLMVGQTVQTQTAGELHVVTEDGGLLALRPNTTFKMLRYQATQDDKSVIDMSLVRGALRSITGWIGKLNPSGYRVNTATATIGIRGTDHEVTFVEAGTGRDHAGTYDSVLEGATFVRTALGELHLQAGQHGFAARDAQGAPGLLAERPEFLGQRSLRLEERIAERKEKLGQRVRQMIDANPDVPKAVREKLDSMTDEQRDAARKKLLRRAQRRNAD